MAPETLRILIELRLAARLIEEMARSPTCEARTLPCAGQEVTLHICEMTDEMRELFEACEWLDARVCLVCELETLRSSFRVLQNERGAWCISELTTDRARDFFLS